MKERTKIVRAKKNTHKFDVSQRLSDSHSMFEEVKRDAQYVFKRRKVGESTPSSIHYETVKTP